MNINIAKIKDCINYFISTNKILIFSKTFCPYSSFVKEVFDALREVYKVIELDTLKDGKYWLETLTTITGSKCVPQVFVNGKYIGGAQEIEALLKSGDLQRMIKLQYLLPDMPLIAESGSGSPRRPPRRPPREPSKEPPREPSRSRESSKEPPKTASKKPRRFPRRGKKQKTSQDSTCRCKTAKGSLQGGTSGTT